MKSIRVKADHVRGARQSREHTCHWPDCEKQVPPAMWGCKTHWFKLPVALRSKIWATYQIGQEESGSPSREYLTVARQVQEWTNEQCVP
jgi:hypothetical protein